LVNRALPRGLADEIASSFPDGTYAVNLVPIENDALVPKAVLSALALVERADRTELEVISEHLKEKRALLVIDNCEHLIEGCSHLVDHLLRAAPKIRLITSSREPLLLSGESVMAVPPLSVPEPNSASVSDGSGRYEAVELFLTLVKQQRPDFEVEQKDMAQVGGLCRLLEGIPLAIELAAVQVGAYTVDQIIDVMSDRFRLLQRRGGRTYAIERWRVPLIGATVCSPRRNEYFFGVYRFSPAVGPVRRPARSVPAMASRRTKSFTCWRSW